MVYIISVLLLPSLTDFFLKFYCFSPIIGRSKFRSDRILYYLREPCVNGDLESDPVRGKEKEIQKYQKDRKISIQVNHVVVNCNMSRERKKAIQS